ncbi:MAG: Gfo/Idh/MocA family protein [Anaerolineae bacterium]|jgi:predicted dehydrogenase|nr:Gfo/Idh/MocA family oxidoreductase [Chloroflexota bacterium]
MVKRYRVAVIGFAHMHVNHLVDTFAALPNVEWVGCADTVPAVEPLSNKPSTRRANLQRALQVTGIPRAWEDYRELLSSERPDIVIVCPENARHGEVVEAAAAAGAHILTEKPMSSTLGDALRMARAVRQHGVELMVNWPTTWSPAVRRMKELLDAGTIGEILQVKWRNGASMGPLAYNTGADTVLPAEKGSEWWHQSAPGGGVLLDYCCYGACLSRWFLGEPATAALGIKANLDSPYGDAEDNAILTVRFPRALALLEATWTTWATGVPTGPIVYGTRGTLVADSATDATGQVRPAVKVYTTRGQSPASPDAVDWGEPLPAGRATEAEEFIHHLETGEPLHPTLQLELNLDAMAILDAGIRSAGSGQLELVNDLRWSIGLG